MKNLSDRIDIDWELVKILRDHGFDRDGMIEVHDHILKQTDRKKWVVRACHHRLERFAALDKATQSFKTPEPDQLQRLDDLVENLLDLLTEIEFDTDAVQVVNILKGNAK